jgi:signal transduction histidine kinase
MSHSVASMRAYVDFTARDEDALRRLAPHLPSVQSALVEDFYRVILEHPEARAVFADEAQIERLKHSLADWLARLLHGPFDDEWFERAARIGRRHVEVGLPQRFMPLAMNRLRCGLVRFALATDRKPSADRAALVAAIEKALDLELTVMLESYAEMHHGRVRQSARLAALGQLAAGVGQELKNPLGVINTSLLLIDRSLAHPDAALEVAQLRSTLRTHLDRIGRSAKQAALMSTQLLDYARSKRPQVRTVELALLLKDVLLAADEGATGVAIESICTPENATARLDPGDLSQVLANLVRNSLQAIRESGRGRRVTVAARRDATGVAFSVSDDGPGIAPEHLPRIFDPLYTTRSGSTGLGLSISRDLVEAHGGRLTVASTPGRGAQFTIHLPQEDAAAGGEPR